MASCPLAPYGVEERQDRQNNNDINKKKRKTERRKKNYRLGMIHLSWFSLFPFTIYYDPFFLCKRKSGQFTFIYLISLHLSPFLVRIGYIALELYC